MRTNLVLIVVVILGLLAFTVLFDTAQNPSSHTLGSDTSAQSISATQPAETAPDFSFKDLGGKTHSLSSLRGKVVLLNFWASWCAPCVVEFPKLLQLAGTMKGEVVVLALSSDRDRAAIEKFLTRLPQDTQALTKSPNIVIGWDEGARISSDLFQTVKLPESILIDPKGRMTEKIVGDTDWLGAEMMARLKTLAAAP
jgi:cytochrome c biogenesis protein CcmG/thiol:disulfide interchange protein DsbE